MAILRVISMFFVASLLLELLSSVRATKIKGHRGADGTCRHSLTQVDTHRHVLTHELKHQNSKELRVLRERIYREDLVHQVLFQVLQQKTLQAAVAWKKSRYQAESGEHQDLTNRDSQKCLAGVLRNKRGCYNHAN